MSNRLFFQIAICLPCLFFQEVTSFWQGEKKLVSLDDLFPVFQFVVIRARYKEKDLNSIVLIGPMINQNFGPLDT